MYDKYTTHGPVVFTGRSDDLVEVSGLLTEDGHLHEEEYCAGDFRGVRWVVGGCLEVRAYYNGCWCFSVGLVWSNEHDGGAPIPFAWSANVYPDPDCHYSMCLRLDVSNGLTFDYVRGT